MPSIHKNQNGALDALLIPLILAILLLIGAGAFAAWAFSSRQDYKNNTDQKITMAVTAAEKKTTETDTAQAAEAAKQPLKSYNGPEAFGSVVIKYQNVECLR
jgi:flagellar basal body-associated protein FliL